jgi:tetratricopeptide (TPR) repeat protein
MITRKYLFYKCALILSVLILNENNLNAQVTEFDSLINIGINQIYNIKFDEAEKTFSKVNNLYPTHPAGKFFDAMIVWWKIMLDQNNEQYDELFEDKLEEVIDFCNDLLDEDSENVDAIFFKGGSLGFRGRLYSIRKEWFDAALDGKDALPLVYEAYEIDPANEDVKLGFGIYNYYASAIPEKYPFIKPAMIFFPEGDKEKGIRQLKSSAENAKYAAIESQFFLLTLYYQFENDYDKALKYAEGLHQRFPNNPVFQKYLGRIFIKKGDYASAAVYFKDINDKGENGKLGYTPILMRESSYYLGVDYMRRNLIDSAKISFEKCVDLSLRIDEDKDEESGFQINAILYLAKIASQTDNNELAINYYERILEMRDYRNSHKKAEKYLKKLKI